MTATRATAAAFAALHTPARPLALANAWDVASARLVEAAGAAAVATTSAACRLVPRRARRRRPRPRPRARPHRPRGRRRLRARHRRHRGRLRRRPHAASARPSPGSWPMRRGGDQHRGRQPRPRRPRRPHRRRPRRRGGRRDPPLHQRPRGHVPLRPRRTAHPPRRDPRPRRRLPPRGASGIFVPGVTDPSTIAELAKGIDAPLNVLVGPGAPAVAELGALGAARVSLGSGVAEAAYAVVRRATEELLTAGTYETLGGSLPYGELNALLKG